MMEIELWRDRQNMIWDLKSNRPFSKMAAENLNKLIKISQNKKKTLTSTRKNTFTLVPLQSFSISGVASAEKMLVENWKIFLFVWYYTPSHTNVCKFFNS